MNLTELIIDDNGWLVNEKTGAGIVVEKFLGAYMLIWELNDEEKIFLPDEIIENKVITADLKGKANAYEIGKEIHRVIDNDKNIIKGMLSIYFYKINLDVKQVN